MSRIRIQIASDSDYERLVAEIYIDDKFVMLVNQERGSDDLGVDLPGPDQSESALLRSVSHSLLTEALSAAKERLLEK